MVRAARVPRVQSDVIDTSRVHPQIRLQVVDMFCSKTSHIRAFYAVKVYTVADAMRYVEQYGVPEGMSRRSWRTMVERMEMYREYQ